VDVERRRDAADDLLLDVEPLGERDRVAIAPHHHGRDGVAEGEHQADDAALLVGASLDQILRRRRPRARLGVLDRRRHPHRPLAEPDQARDQFVTESVDEMPLLIGNAAGIERHDRNDELPGGCRRPVRHGGG